MKSSQQDRGGSAKLHDLEQEPTNCKTADCCAGPKIDRRLLLKGTAAASMSLLMETFPFAKEIDKLEVVDHHVPADKHLDPEWVKALFARGVRKVYRGQELETIGMPCGGVCAGQLYVRGDGTLAKWWIANNAHNTGVYWGRQEDREADYVINTPLGQHKAAYRSYRPESYIDQGFAVRVKADGEEPLVRTLNRDDFDDIHFIGEYPIATINYRSKEKPSLPVDVQLEVFSPFVPLNARDSAHPATVLRCTVKNTGSEPVDVSVAGWLQNAVCLGLKDLERGHSRNLVVRGAGITSVQMDLLPPVPESTPARRIVMFEDFEDGTYQNWTVEGEAFGKAPTKGTLSTQELRSGWQGRYFANSLVDGKTEVEGRLISKTFEISEAYLAFLIGSGFHGSDAGMNLVVDGRVVRTATGTGNPEMKLRWWNLEDLMGKRAHLEINDLRSGLLGHVAIDQIYFTNRPPETLSLKDNPQFGNMALSALDSQAAATASWKSKEAFLAGLASDSELGGYAVASRPLGEKLCGVITSSFRLDPGDKQDATFLLTWYFPNRQQENRFTHFGAATGKGQPVGNMYSNWYNSSLDVARTLAENFERLDHYTHLFRDTYFDTTLPYWFAQRIAMQLSTLATETCQWWENGRFWGFEGVGCCHGTCSHVWHYEQAMARLFPELQRSILSMQTFDPQAGFDVDTGMVPFRGEGWKWWAADGQAANILMALREHQFSVDDNFLRNHWPYIRKALEFLIEQDANGDGLIEGRQGNTYDIPFFGANTMIGSLYLAALRAGEVMARVMGEIAFAERCRRIYLSGRKLTVERLFNGEYFIQEVDLQQYPTSQYADGCLSDQVIGQTWAHQLDLGYLYPRQAVRSALQSVWKYNWAPDIEPQIQAHRPEIHFADPGEAGLFLCTWPKSKHLGDKSVRYRNTVWTGIEFQVAAQMVHEGMLTEGLAMVRAIHERYDGTKHNPWNLILCGDHYSRAMASWGCLLAASGFVHDGTSGMIGFAPRLNPESFKSFFSAAEGWGSLGQQRAAEKQTNSIELKWGTLHLKTLRLQLPSGARLEDVTITVSGRRIEAKTEQKNTQVTFTLDEPILLAQDQAIDVAMSFKENV